MLKKSGTTTLQFLGATETVTGSKFLLSNSCTSWMIDCGLFQGLKDLRLKNWSPLPVAPKDVASVILTHAHIDHSGYLPIFIKNGFRGEVLASEATIELCKILLPDAGYLQEEDAKYASKKGFSRHSTVLPLYTYQDALATFPYFRPIPDSIETDIGGDTTLELFRAGHILGSRFVKISMRGKTNSTILFAGDIGGYNTLLAHDPTSIEEGIDYLVLESTYGDHLHPDEDVFERFENIINKTLDSGGKVMIPSFAVGRTQEVLYILKQLLSQKRIPKNIPIYLNTPLGIDATNIYNYFASEHRIFKGMHDPDMFHFPNLTYVHAEEDSKELNRLKTPAIIISASGMMTGGRILHHLKAYGGDPNSTLVIVGFQAAGTRGRSILDGAKTLKIHGQPIAIRCHIEFVESLSAHGDWGDIMKWLHKFRKPPKTIFLVHGEPEALESMKGRIGAGFKGTQIIIPKFLEKFELL